MTETQDGLLFLVYTSFATGSLSDDDLDQIHALSRRNNERNGLSGLLLYRQGRFIQALEGPDEPVRERMSVIADDPRHTAVRTLVEENVGRRRFPHWAMEYRPLTPAMADTVPGYEAVFTELDRKADPPAVQLPLEALLRWYQARAAQSW
jgi:hypothetical protein